MEAWKDCSFFHIDRDFEFATAHGIPIIGVVSKKGKLS